AVVTVVDPDFYILEMCFDDYLRKPVNETELKETVERLLVRADYDERVQEYFSVLSKQSALESEKETSELGRSDEYEKLKERRRELEEELDSILDRMEPEDFEAVVYNMEPTPS
ncbi:MAG: HalX domain-containing protein, partial [Halobacteria archaeon]|nr:HalX domain-containing protein [Halobacteria archaeon]